MTLKASAEPLPGECLSVEDFAGVVRLTPLVAIDLIVRDSAGRVLLGERKNEPAKGSFFVPGGRITKNETLTAAFRRITRAELGVERSLTDSPFYARSLVRTRLLGRDALAMHEVLSAERLRRGWVRFLLGFRMARTT